MSKSNIVLCTVLAVSAMALTSCATVGEPDNSSAYSLLDAALIVDMDYLEQTADNGDARSQYALGIIYQYGLRGHNRDAEKSVAYKNAALKQRGYTTITQYIPGLNGSSGRTALMNTPRYDVSAHEAQRADVCADGLHRGRLFVIREGFPAPLPQEYTCGNIETFERLKNLWN